ncbi:MAG: hypothetical protein ACSHX8_07300 [Opitutaceae bacterium]
MSSTLSQNSLKHIIAGCPGNLPRTDRLQQQIRIGVGYHNKWYRSQKEHWLGWIVAQEYMAIEKRRDITLITAHERWKRLNCIPMMFWLAEAAGLDDEYLSNAEAISKLKAAETDHDCPQHGKAMREALPWDLIEMGLITMPPEIEEISCATADAAFDRLTSLRSEFRRLKNRVKPTL